MATSNLNFTKQDKSYVAKFTSQGTCVIEIERNEQSLIVVNANFDGMKEVPIASFNNPYVTSEIFELDLAEGIEVTIKSGTEVTNAKMSV